MGMKLAILGAVAAGGVAALGVANAAYKYYFDPDEGGKRRSATLGVVQNAASKYGLDGMGKASMQNFMETLASAGR